MTAAARKFCSRTWSGFVTNFELRREGTRCRETKFSSVNSHQDTKWRDDLEKYLKPYLRAGSIKSWSDKQIAPSSKWFAEIKSALTDAKVAVLLVTPVVQDHVQAVYWYRKAAEAGNATAMNNLGAMCENGEGVAQDYVQAFHWYQRASEAGDTAAMPNLGYLFANGKGAPQDFAKAYNWYQKAAKGGNAAAKSQRINCSHAP